MMTPNPYRGFRFPVEVIQHAVWLYHCFSLSLRGVELILAARGVVVSYETIREWGLRFGRIFANTLKRRRARPFRRLYASRRLAANHGMIASFSRALAEDLRHSMSDAEFDATLARSIDEIPSLDRKGLTPGCARRGSCVLS
jgi:putative transposase